MRIVVDSSVFVAAFRESEPYAREAFRILQQIEKGILTAVIPTIVVLEVAAAIRRRTGSESLAQQVGEKLLSFSAISLIDVTAFRMLDYLDLAARIGLSGMDSIVVGVAREFDLPLMTLDKEMAARSQLEVKIINI